MKFPGRYMNRSRDKQVPMHGACSAAYAYDGRAPGWQAASATGAGSWHPRLSRLAGAGYIFLHQCYAPGGTLFRGMGAGLIEALAAAAFWHFHSDRPLARLECDLDVIFCSEHAGDALAAARPWESASGDAGLLLFSSDRFVQRYHERAAAMLALADPGMVFKYPLLAEPLAWGDLDCVLISPQGLQRCQAAIAGDTAAGLDETVCRGLQALVAQGLFAKLHVVTATGREAWARAAENCLRCPPAMTVEAADTPRRSAGTHG